MKFTHKKYAIFRIITLENNKISFKRIILIVFQGFNSVVKLTVETVCFIIKSRC